MPRCSRCSPFRLAVRDCGIFRRYCGQTGAPVRGKQSNTPTLKPTTRTYNSPHWRTSKVGRSQGAQERETELFIFFSQVSSFERMRKWGRESDHALTNELFTQKGHAYRFVRDWPRDIDDGWDRPAKSKSNILLPTNPSTHPPPSSTSTSSRAQFAQVLPRKMSQKVFF